MGWRRIRPDEVEPGMLAVGGVPMDMTGEAIGQRFGPEAVRTASRFLHRYLVRDAGPGGVVNVCTGRPVHVRDGENFVDVGDAPIFDAQIERSSNAITEWMHGIVASGAFPLMLAGDHYTTYPLIRGYHDAKVAAGQRHIGYIHVDAHLDLEQIDDYGLVWWGSESLLVSELAAVDPKNMVFFASSGEVHRSEWDWVQEHGATIISADVINKGGVEDAVAQALEIAGTAEPDFHLHDRRHRRHGRHRFAWHLAGSHVLGHFRARLRARVGALRGVGRDRGDRCRRGGPGLRPSRLDRVARRAGVGRLPRASDECRGRGLSRDGDLETRESVERVVL